MEFETQGRRHCFVDVKKIDVFDATHHWLLHFDVNSFDVTSPIFDAVGAILKPLHCACQETLRQV